MRGVQRPIKTQRTMDFNLPRNIIERIKKRQLEHQGRMDEAAAERVMSADMTKRANENALMTTTPKYKESVRADKHEKELDKIGATAQGNLDVQSLRNKGVLEAGQKEFDFAKEAYEGTQGIMTPSGSTPDTSPPNWEQLMGADDWGGQGVKPSKQNWKDTDSFLKEQRDMMNSSSDILAPGSTRVDKYLGINLLKQGLRAGRKGFKKGVVEPIDYAWNWWTSPAQ